MKKGKAHDGKAFAVCILIFILLLSACRERMEEDHSSAVEQSYDDGGLSSDPSDEAEDRDTDGWKTFTWQDSFYGADGKAEIHVDITGRYPKEEVPVLRLTHHSRTVGDLKKAASILMPAETYYDPTKLIEPEILQSWVRNDKNSHRFDDLPEEINSDPAAAETDWQMHPSSENYYSLIMTAEDERSNDGELAVRTARDGDGNFGFMRIYDNSGSTFWKNELEYYKADGYQTNGLCYGVRDKNKDPKNMLTKEETLEMVQKKLDELHAGMHTAKISGGPSGRTMWCYPTYFGIDYLCMQLQKEDVQYRPECILVEVRGDEIYHLRWFNAADVAIENEVPVLLSKEEAMDAAKKQMQESFTGAGAADGGIGLYTEDIVQESENIRIDVTRMEFGYVRTAVEDEPSEFRLVPAWVFYGRSVMEYRGEVLPVITGDANPGLAKGQILMVISAVDGSRITANRESFD